MSDRRSSLARRVGDLTTVYAHFLNASRVHPDIVWLAEARDLAWFQLVEAHDAYTGKKTGGVV